MVPNLNGQPARSRVRSWPRMALADSPSPSVAGRRDYSPSVLAMMLRWISEVPP